jgi:hypothetical protein
VRTDCIYTDSYEVQELEASYVFVTDFTRMDASDPQSRAVDDGKLNASWYGHLGCDASGLVYVQVRFGPGPPKLSVGAAISAKFGMHEDNMQNNI